MPRAVLCAVRIYVAKNSSYSLLLGPIASHSARGVQYRTIDHGVPWEPCKRHSHSSLKRLTIV
jgi:hypothetical protein